MLERRAAVKPEMAVIAIALGAALLWGLDLGVLRAGTPHPLDDTWEYGLTARSLLAGHGFRTRMLHPPLWGLHDRALTVPVLIHGPLLPLIDAPLLAAFGPAAIDRVAWLAAAFAALAALFTARALARHAGWGAGAVAAAMVTVSPLMIGVVHHDIAPAAGACFVALALDGISRPRPSGFAIGLALGAGALVRPELLLTLPCAALALGWGSVLPLAIGAALPLLPWALHSLAATGSPTFTLSSYLLIAYTRSHPGLSPLFDFGIPPARWPAALAATRPELPAKWAQFSRHALRLMVNSPANGFGLLAALGAGIALRRRAADRRLWAALAAALIPFAVSTVTEWSDRYFAVFLPLWAIAAVMGADALGRRIGRVALVRALVLVALLPFAVTTMRDAAGEAAALRQWLAAERTALASRGAPALQSRLLFSDTPDFAAWTTGRPTLALTSDVYRELPTPGSAESGGLPARGGPLDEWFHRDTHARPAPSRGGPAE